MLGTSDEDIRRMDILGVSEFLKVLFTLLKMLSA